MAADIAPARLDPVDDPDVIARVVAILNAHRPAKATRPHPASNINVAESEPRAVAA